MDKNLLEYLETHKIRYEEFKHQPVFTVEESKNLKTKIPGMHCKTLFLKDEQEKYHLVAMKADKRLDTKKLRNYLGAKKLNFASEEELKEKINAIPGSVSIFAAIYARDTKLIVDSEVWNAEKTGFHPNINTLTLVLEHKDLEKFYNSLKIKKFILDL